MTRRNTIYRLLLALLVALLHAPATASAHGGAPYALFVDRQAGPYLLTLFADPDVGTGAFYVDIRHNGAAAPAGTAATLVVWPDDGHSGEVRTVAEPDPSSEGKQFIARLPLDAQGAWSGRLEVTGPAGQASTAFAFTATRSFPAWISSVFCIVAVLAVAGYWLLGAPLRPKR